MEVNNKIEIIPAIDLIEGKCVRLTQGDYSKKTIYNENPLEVAKQFEGIGIKRLHLVDLDGAKAGKVVNFKVLETIGTNTGLVIDFGGGIKTTEMVQNVLDAGASKATVGSIAVKNSELFYSWIKQFGPSRVFLGADVKNELIAISGWLETTELHILDFLKGALENGLTEAFCTDVSKDGMLEGPSIDLYKKIIEAFPNLGLVASGGVAKLSDLENLRLLGCSGVIVGKAIYENKISMQELTTYLKHAN